MSFCETTPQTDTSFFFIFALQIDRRQYEPEAEVCVSAALLAFQRCAGLQTLCVCPHNPHTSDAGCGGGQLMVVCIHVLMKDAFHILSTITILFLYFFLNEVKYCVTAMCIHINIFYCICPDVFIEKGVISLSL